MKYPSLPLFARTPEMGIHVIAVLDYDSGHIGRTSPTGNGFGSEPGMTKGRDASPDGSNASKKTPDTAFRRHGE